MPPGSATASRRAATLTPSPKMSAPSLTMSPRLMPILQQDRIGRGFVRLGEPRLQVTGGVHGIDGAGELDKHAVAHELHDAPAVVVHHGSEDFLAPLPQGGQRRSLVRLHEARVTDHVGDEDGGKAACQGISPCAARTIAHSRPDICNPIGPQARPRSSCRGSDQERIAAPLVAEAAAGAVAADEADVVAERQAASP